MAKAKEIVKYTLPPLLLDAGRAVKLLLKRPALGRALRQNLRWRDAYIGKNVYVLGNGPSLAGFDRSVLRGRQAIVMNSFERADWKNEVKIVAHCIGEPRMSPSWGEHISASINGTDSASYWLHFSSMGQLQRIKHEKPVYYVFPSIEAGLWPNRKLISLHGSTMGYATTAQLAIQVALYMGFQKIMLLGFDHDWLASPKYLEHFYSKEKDPADTLDQHTYLSIIEFSRRMWTIYYKLKEVARAHGAHIYNLSTNSYLDVFERSELKE